MLSNSQPAFDALVERFKQCLNRGRQDGTASLIAYRDAGGALRELKELLPRGVFGRVANELCGHSKQWRARLMELDREWPHVEAALHWAEEAGRPLGAKAYSVDGALALLKEWRGTRSPGADPVKPHSRASKARSASAIRDNYRLRAAVAYVSALEERLAACRPAAPEQVPLNDQDRVKILKVGALWHRGGTAGESAAAVHKLFEIADRLGWDLPGLLRECGIESPAHWTLERRNVFP